MAGGGLVHVGVLALWLAAGCARTSHAPEASDAGSRRARSDASAGEKVQSVCATSKDCADSDPCTVNERCNPRSRTCEYSMLDGDGDGRIPIVCGGVDCDDSTPLVPAAFDRGCERAGIDDDCDGHVDEDADLDRDPLHCGSCTKRCESGACEAGQCKPCGGVGEACCQGVTCHELIDGYALCIDGMCVGCGAPSQSCCPTDSRQANACRQPQGTFACIDEHCEACGAPDQACCPDRASACPGASAADPAACIDGRCRRCGTLGAKCCPAEPGTSACPGTGFTDCVDGLCEECGANGQRCCTGSAVCRDGFLASCNEGRCEPRTCAATVTPGRPATPPCTQDIADCLRACDSSAAGACVDDCRARASELSANCDKCMGDELERCAETHGCDVTINAWRCCVTENCPSAAIDITRTTGCGPCESNATNVTLCAQGTRLACAAQIADGICF